MAQIDIPDDPAWRRYFAKLVEVARNRPRISKETRIELNGGKTGVRCILTEETFTPDQ
jgi:hypothetical protein